jgi:Glycosyltransferase like family
MDALHPGGTDSSLSFVCCVSREDVLRSNLLASPCLGRGSSHEVILVKNCPSAADGLNLGVERAAGDWVVGVHQDVFLPEGLDRRLMLQLREAERRFGPVGVAGVYGVGPARELRVSLAAERIGRVVDRGRVLRDGPELPALAATLDELLLVLRRDSPLRFDPGLGFHLYGADICLQAAERRLAVVVIEALCHHNSRSVGLPAAFYTSAQVFARKWAHRLPVATPCVIIDRSATVHLLGNAAGPRSIAYPLAGGRPLTR